MRSVPAFSCITLFLMLLLRGKVFRKGGLRIFWPYIWLAVIIFAAILEAATTQLVSIWFVVGGIGALAASIFQAPLALQILIFASVSAVALVATRPFVRRVLTVRPTSTNADRYIGKIGIVTVTIDNSRALGQVNVLGSIWTARSVNNTVIEVGKHVLVESIDGVKLMVRTVEP